ncbi:UNVERIFIED_CONTAM: hypothetical protein GTU68_020157 [Idotea baltica]|nr:hypothetical protein [Idotea baltica]
MTQTKKKLYNMNHLSGLKVQHDAERFSDGRTTILTLKDSVILDAEEDTLVNVNMEDAEREERNLKRKRKDADTATDDYAPPSVDADGNIVSADPLSKYDEEIEGQRNKSFRIGRGGWGAEMAPQGGQTGPLKLDKLRKLTSLDVPASQLATEYLTTAEMTSFRKVKKRKKKRKMLTADDLMPLDDPSTTDLAASGKRVKSLRELMEEEVEEKVQEEIEQEVEVEEDSDGEKDVIELQEALSRFRRAKQSADSTRTLPTTKPVPQPTQNHEQDANMILNLTDEFCRSLGDIPTYGLSGNRADEDAVQLPESVPATAEAWDTHGAWEEVDIEETKVEIASERSAPILEEEPDTGIGVVNALRLAVKKGYLEKGNDKKNTNATLQHLRAINYSIEDKAVEDERRGRGGGDRYMGPTMDFREKDLYKPDVKLEYVDDEGRKLNAKEAFRYLSHNFHGKGSGKNKLEKRMKKWQEELLMKHMSSSDTPLQTLERQREKQKQLGAAYLVLSGSKTQESLDVKK